MHILQHLNRGYFILHPLKKSHKYSLEGTPSSIQLQCPSFDTALLFAHCPPSAPDAGGYSKREGWCSKRAKVHCCMHLGQGSIERK